MNTKRKPAAAREQFSLLQGLAVALCISLVLLALPVPGADASLTELRA